MNEREAKRGAITAFVVAVCGIVLGASLLVIASVDRGLRAERLRIGRRDALTAPRATRERLNANAALRQTSEAPLLASAAPARGLRRAPAVARRRVVIVRRTRAS